MYRFRGFARGGARLPCEVSEMKYACACVLDQTIGYLVEGGGVTIEHPKAQLFDDFDEAIRATDDDGWWVVEVEDETEFRARPDTW